jgi:hypothetical protein
MILFQKTLFGTWYKGVLFSLILCKQFIHIYNVELGYIWIWEYIKNCANNWFEKYLNSFLKYNHSQLKHGINGNILDFFIINVNVY